METNSERRRRKLAELCEQRSIQKVAQSADLNWASLDQIIKKTLLPPKKDGTRSIKNLGDDAARKIERAEGLGEGWFDTATEDATNKPPSKSLLNSPLAPASIASPAIKDVATLEQITEALAGYLREMSPKARHSAASALRDLTEDPEEHAFAAAMLSAAFHSGKRKVA